MVLASIHLEHWNGVTVCIKEVVDVVHNAEHAPVAPGFGGSSSTGSGDTQGNILHDSAECICEVVLELRWSRHYDP